MLDAGGGGGYGGTDWNSKDVRFMWAAIANQETDSHFDVVQGWSRTADLTLAHLGQVQKYRDNLASVWPPSKSPAAAAYIERLDKLLADLQATHDAAAANHTAFATVTQTLNSARLKLKPLLEQYEANEQLNLDWQAKQDAAAAQNPAPLTPQFAMPPVSAARQEQLNNEARVVMYDLSNTVISGQAALKKPRPYDPAAAGSKTDESRTGGDEGGAGFATPPMIPPPGSSTSGVPSSNAGYTPSSSSLAHQPTTSSPGAAHGPVGTGGSGPVLGGIGQPSVISPPATGLPNAPITGPTPLPNGPGVVPGVITPPGGSPVPVPGGSGSNTSRPHGGGGGGFKSGGATGPTGRLAMPSGTVIGAPGGFVGQVPGGPTTGRGGAAARPNPVGGVIGQPGPGQPTGPNGRGGPVARPGGGASVGPGQSGHLLGRPGRRSGAEDNAERPRWDPDNPWATDEGVDPVLRPSADPGPIDPGPAIGYRR